MSPTGARLSEAFRATFLELVEHAKDRPDEAERILGALISHARSYRPESITPLSIWPATEPTPTEPPGGAP